MLGELAAELAGAGGTALVGAMATDAWQATRSIPATQRASDASLHARLNAALERNRTLTQENQRLRRQLATTLGEQRTSPPPNTSDPTPQPATHHFSTTIGPH